jgi:hypothetical protein
LEFKGKGQEAEFEQNPEAAATPVLSPFSPGVD